MTNSGWRDTLWVWDGILTKEKDSDVMKWEGTCVACEESPDATKVEAPKRGAFDEFVTSELKFEVEGKIEEKEGSHQILMVDGDGWDWGGDDDGAKTKKKDQVHTLTMVNLKWTGNLMDQRNNLVFAMGKNEYSPFIAAGWMRPGNRLTLGRRYLEEKDPRCEWTCDQVKEAALELVYDAKLDKVRIPPWQCDTFHVDYKEASKKREREEDKDDGTPESTKQKTDEA